MTEAQQKLAVELLTEIVEALEDKLRLSIWEKMVLDNAKEILTDDS